MYLIIGCLGAFEKFAKDSYATDIVNNILIELSILGFMIGDK